MHASTESADAGRHGAHPTSGKGPPPGKDTKRSKVCIDSMHPTSPSIFTKACGWHLVIMSNMLYAVSSNKACIIPPTRCKVCTQYTAELNHAIRSHILRMIDIRYQQGVVIPCSLYSSARMCRCFSPSQMRRFSSYSCRPPN